MKFTRIAAVGLVAVSLSVAGLAGCGGSDTSAASSDTTAASTSAALSKADLIAAATQAYLDWQDANDRAPKTMIKYRDVLTRFAAHCRDAGVRLMHAITTQTVDEFGVRRRRDGGGAPRAR